MLIPHYCPPPPQYFVYQYNRKTKHSFIPALFLFFLTNFHLYSQNLLEGIFFDISGQYYALPDLSGAVYSELHDRYGVSSGVIPYPGFRAGAGYEWKRWSFALESGLSYIKGDNPLVTDILIVPLLLRAGFSFFPFSGYEYFSLTPIAAFGFAFSQVDHYRDVIDMLTENPSHSRNAGFMARIGARAGWNPVRQWGRRFELFAGFSVDGVIEREGLIPLPQIEIGILIRPFAPKRRPLPQQAVYAETDSMPEQPDSSAEWRIVHRQAVYFEANSVFMPAQYMGALDEAGRMLRADPLLRVTLCAYHAPGGVQWQVRRSTGEPALSAARADYIAEYLRWNYGVARERIKVEHIEGGENQDSHRCVELVIRQGEKL